jgi:exonuclease III
MRIISINVRGLTVEKWLGIREMGGNFDIVLIQETHFDEEKVEDFERKVKGWSWAWGLGKSNSKGVALG